MDGQGLPPIHCLIPAAAVARSAARHLPHELWSLGVSQHCLLSGGTIRRKSRRCGYVKNYGGLGKPGEEMTSRLMEPQCKVLRQELIGLREEARGRLEEPSGEAPERR